MRLAWAVALLYFITIAAAAAAERPEELTRRQTFVVQAMLDQRTAQIGAGVVVQRAGDVLTLATAAHVVDGGRPLRVLDSTRRGYYDVLGVQLVPGYDMALVRVRAHPDFAVEPAQFGTPQLGAAVWLWGHPLTAFWSLASGTIVETRAQLPGTSTPRIAIACPACDQGDSGSGVFGEDGRLIGILSAGWHDAQGRTLFVEVEPVTPLAQALVADAYS